MVAVDVEVEVQVEMVAAVVEADAVDVVEPLVGVGYRRELAGWLKNSAGNVRCLEITAEHFFNDHMDTLKSLADTYELYVHGLGVSLGTPGPLDSDYLKQFAAVASAARAKWVSEHIAYTRFGNIDLGHLTPVRPTRDNAYVIAEHARQLADVCDKPVLLENITSHVKLPGDLTEPEFLNLICEASGCGLLLDVANLYINSRNLGFDASQWLRDLDTSNVRQLHIVGYAERDGRLEDDHSAAIQPELMVLLGEILDCSPVRAVILERDANFPDEEAMQNEVDRIADAIRGS